MYIEAKKMNATVSAKVIQVLAGGEIKVSELFHQLIRLEGNGTVVLTIQWKDLPYTTAKPSEIILVQMDGSSETFTYVKAVKHGKNSFTYTYQSKEDVGRLLRLIHIS